MALRTTVFGNEYISRIAPDDTNNPYVLQVMLETLGDKALCVVLEDRRTKALSTGRTVEEYKRYIPFLAFVDGHAAAGMRFAEVGPGLSEFMPYLSSIRTAGQPPPLAIDPLDYSAAEDLLTGAMRLAEFGASPFREQLERIFRMLQACQAMRDATRVQLLNCTLGQAVKRHPQILGRQNVVIDLYGASEYAHVEEGSSPSGDEMVRERQLETVIALQRLLLTPDGLLLNTRKRA